MSRPALAIALPFMLGACTTMYPPLYSAPTIAGVASPGEPALYEVCRNSTDPLAQTIACEQILQGVYSTGYEKTAQWQDISQLPIIGAAGAAAWILLKDKPNAALKVGKIGIGTGVYAAGRGQLLPSGIPEVFIKGHVALGCVLAEEVYFQGDAARQSLIALDNSLTETALQAEVVSWLRYTEPSDPATAPALLQAARTLADQAITAANVQLRVSRQQRAAKLFAASPFRQSVEGIAGWVASKGRDRPDKSYKDLLKDMSSSPAPTGKTLQAALSENSGANANFADPAASHTSIVLIRDIGRASQQLTADTAELMGNTPPYVTLLEQVGKCATDLPDD
jgi:hypothetical protein